ncbi:MAG: GFA family protein [Phenylobacterium sp.]
MSETRDGGCRCGQVRFSLSAAPVVTMACHCRGCQRMTASAFSLSALVPSAAFAVTEGEPVIGGLHGATRHYFCPHCMSWMFTRPEGVDAFVNVRSTLLDDPSGLDPFTETMTSEKLPWVTTPAVESFEGFPTTADFGRLMQAYAARGSAQPTER